jgi:tripartite-type tricarboxylate transporter receptor subunit TctC
MTYRGTVTVCGSIFIAAIVALPVDAISAAVPATQAYPSKPIRFVIPFPAGGFSDITGRVVAQKLSERMGQPVVSDNRPGASGNLGAEIAARSAPDGYTLLINSINYVINPAVLKAPFDPVKDFAGVSIVASAPVAALVPADSPAKTLKEFIALAQKEPGKLNFGSAGVASTTFLATEVMRQEAKLNMVHVPFKGAPEAVTAVLRGDVQLYFAPIPSAVSLGGAGKVRVLAVNSAKRAPQLPDVPTVAEAALPNYRYESWFGVMAPAGTPPAVLNKVSQDIAAVLKMKDVIDQMYKVGNIPMPTTPAEFDKIISGDTARYSKVMADAGIAPK